MLVSPDNFGLVEPGIYRCSKLDSDNFPFLETLRLKSLIVLDAEKPPRHLNHFVESNRIELFNLGSLKISNHHHTGNQHSSKKEDFSKDEKDGRSSSSTSSRGSYRSEHDGIVDDKTTLDVINLNLKGPKTDQWMLIEKNLISKAFELLLNKGKHNILLVDSTSTLIGILRKIQKWNFNSILNEYKTYTGNSSKSNYYAENFLELIQVELIPYEIDQMNQQVKKQTQESKDQEQAAAQTPSKDVKKEQVWRTSYLEDKSPVDSANKSPELNRATRKESMDNEVHWDDFDEQSIDDEDSEDDMLSASPQIPANLLKLVEQRKHEKSRERGSSVVGADVMDSDSSITPGTSPNVGRGSRNNSFSNEMFLSAARNNRRRSSIDSKFIRMNSMNKLRNNMPIQPGELRRKSSFESTSPVFKMVKDRQKDKYIGQSEIDSIKSKYDYKYYKNLNKYTVDFENVSVIKLKLPAENKLPDWFIRGRNFWEENLRALNQQTPNPH